MRALLRGLAVFKIALKRLMAQRWLALATALGLVMSIALALSIPLYADAVYYRILRQELWGKPNASDPSDLPLTLLFRFIGGWDKSIEWSDVVPADTFMSQQALDILKLPARHVIRHFRTDNLGLYAAEGGAYDTTRDPMAWVSFGFADGFLEHVTFLDGSMPGVASPDPTSPVPVAISEVLANESGVQMGDQFVAYMRTQGLQADRSIQMPVEITGVWREIDPDDDYWFSEPAKLVDVMFVPEETYKGRVSETLDKEVYLALWYVVLDGAEVHARDVGYLVGRILSVKQRFTGLLPTARLDASPMDALSEYWRASNVLTLLLFAFSVPILGLILAFVGLVVGLVVGRQRNEIAVMRSRGATVGQIVGIAAMEALVLAGLALAAGVPVSETLAHLIGRARSFLDFSMVSSLRVEFTTATLTFGLVAAGLALLAQVVPTIGAARHTVVTYKREQARSLQAPWWQRMGLDFLLLLPTVYGGYLLRQQGSIAVPGVSPELANDPFQNPLLFLVPSLGIFACTLILLRVMPLIMSVVSWVAGRIGGVGLLMATRYLARTPGFYSAPLVLLIMTLSLSAFVASLAQTMDNHLNDQSYYQFGADLRLIEQGDATALQALGITGGGTSQAGGEARWYFLPVSEHLKVPGVRAAARVGRYEVFSNLSGGRQHGAMIGVDRADFINVAFWRKDFSSLSLGGMMNSLGATFNGVLVPRDVYEKHYMSLGDTIDLTVDMGGQRMTTQFTVIGAFDLFPTWYPLDEGQELFVTNLEYLFQEAGAQFPYDVWVRTDPGVSDAAYYDTITEGVRDQGVTVLYWKAPRVTIAEEQQRPQRQGLFGVLSVGFVAAALLTVLGFMLYALFSFRRRFIELGVLRAVGLSTRQMTAFLGWELVLLMVVGIGAGTGLGVWISNLFIPYLQVGSGPAAQIPPFVVQISWPDVFRFYILFGFLFVGALVILVILLFRMKIFQAIKLGESA